MIKKPIDYYIQNSKKNSKRKKKMLKLRKKTLGNLKKNRKIRKTLIIIFEDETRMLKRQLYEKRPIIENKLLSGRQFLATEPTPSDTSDSDSKIFIHLFNLVKDYRKLY